MMHSFFSMIFVLWMISCGSRSQTASLQPAAIVAANTIAEDGCSDTSAVVSFENDVLPILKIRCNPCHFPGGKMYTTMPFDHPETITGHAAGILKRIKQENEVAIIRKFVEESNQKIN